MNIAVDIDEVLAPTITAFISFLREKGIEKKRSDFTSMNWGDVVGVGKEEIIELVYGFFESSHITDLEPESGAREVLIKLSKDHKLFVLSSRQRFLQGLTEKWVHKNFPGLFEKIFVCDNHYDHRSDAPIEKADVCLEHDIHCLIEDDPHHINYALKKGIKVIVMDRPWNSEIKDVVRVKDWGEVMKRFDSKIIK